MNKTIIPLLIIMMFIVAIGAYYLGTQQRHPASNTQPFISPIPQSTIVASPILQIPTGTQLTTVPTASESGNTIGMTPSQVTQNFYSWYVTCVGSPLTTCNYKNSSDVDTTRLSSSIATKFQNGANPIICGKNPPQKVTVVRTSPVTNGKITATVVESYGSGTDVTILVDLQNEKNQWKIIKITCPQP